MAPTIQVDANLDPEQVLRQRLLQELNEAEAADLNQIDKEVGFRKVIEAIIDAQKPVCNLWKITYLFDDQASFVLKIGVHGKNSGKISCLA